MQCWLLQGVLGRSNATRVVSVTVSADLVVDHEVARPAAGDGAGVLASKQHGNQQARDLLLCHLAAAIHILVARITELLQHVFLLVGARAA